MKSLLIRRGWTVLAALGILLVSIKPVFAACVDIGFTCLSTDLGGFVTDVLNIGIGVGALLAVIFMIIGGFGVATSAGNPENLEKAKQTITAAISGLLFILLSVLILRIIGFDILGLGEGVFPF